MAFAGLDFSTDDWSSVVASFEQRGLRWFVESLAGLEPTVFVLPSGLPLPESWTHRVDDENVTIARELMCSRSPQSIGRARLFGQRQAVHQPDECTRVVTASAVLVGRYGTQMPIAHVWTETIPLTRTERVLSMQQAISSVLACLRHACFRLGSGELVNDPSLVADLLIERGHVWLGESLAIWLRGNEGDHDLAVRLLIERMPVLSEFAEWKRIDDAREAEGMTYSIDIDGVTQTAFIGHNSTSAEIVAAINAQIVGVTASVEGDAVTITRHTEVPFESSVARVAHLLNETEAPVADDPRAHQTGAWQERASSRRSRWRSHRR